MINHTAERKTRNKTITTKLDYDHYEGISLRGTVHTWHDVWYMIVVPAYTSRDFIIVIIMMMMIIVVVNVPFANYYNY
jgi:hypothetical protein